MPCYGLFHLERGAGGMAVVIATAAAMLIAGVAHTAGSLSRSGAIAAAIVGTIAMTAGWSWGLFLVGWFVGASALSRAGRVAKLARTGDVVEKGDRRDAGQVLANGGVFTLAAAVSLWRPEWASLAALAGAGALAAAGSDTAATEVGTLWGGPPWSLRQRAGAVPGTSGAVSRVGTIGMLAAAGALAAMAAAFDLIAWSSAGPVAYAAACGALADTIAGAWLQARRWCPRCARETEQQLHRCGTRTLEAGGLAWLTNDRVNLLCTVVGAGVALALV